MALKEKYKDSAEFIIADFAIDETFELLGEEGYDVPYIPMFFFINADGAVIINEAGIFSFEEMSEFIEQVI